MVANNPPLLPFPSDANHPFCAVCVVFATPLWRSLSSVERFFSLFCFLVLACFPRSSFSLRPLPSVESWVQYGMCSICGSFGEPTTGSSFLFQVVF